MSCRTFVTTSPNHQPPKRKLRRKYYTMRREILQGRLENKIERVFHMDFSFEQYFFDACDLSKSDFFMRENEKCPRYLEVDQKRDQLSAKMRKKLGKKKSIFYEWEDAESECQAFESDWMYQKGFRDCLFLLKWAGVFE